MIAKEFLREIERAMYDSKIKLERLLVDSRERSIALSNKQNAEVDISDRIDQWRREVISCEKDQKELFNIIRTNNLFYCFIVNSVLGYLRN
jgi:hypothetical protein